MEHDYSWIYLLFFLMIPLARIIPRLLSKMRGRNSPMESKPEDLSQKPEDLSQKPEDLSQKPEDLSQKPEDLSQKPETEFRKPPTKNMLVLGELNRGTKTFEKIQKNTGFTSEELEEILENLEKNDLLQISQKQGMFGSKIELYPTEKGMKEYYS